MSMMISLLTVTFGGEKFSFRNIPADHPDVKVLNTHGSKVHEKVKIRIPHTRENAGLMGKLSLTPRLEYHDVDMHADSSVWEIWMGEHEFKLKDVFKAKGIGHQLLDQALSVQYEKKMSVTQNEEVAMAIGRLQWGPKEENPQKDLSSHLNRAAAISALSARLSEIQELPQRVINALTNFHNGGGRCTFLWEAVVKSDADLLKLKNFGRRSLGAFKDYLQEHGLDTGMTLDAHMDQLPTP